MRMADSDATLTPALRRALELVADPPSKPDASKGYLDLLGTGSAEDAALPEKTGASQTMWASPVVAMIYDSIQALVRKLFAALLPSVESLKIPQGGTVLDVGCGPASVTALLAGAVGPSGLVLGVDRSEAMLARAVRAESGPQIGFLHADAQRLPLRDRTVDAVVSLAVLHLVPDPVTALAEMARVLRPGGRLTVMVPTAGGPARVWRRLSNGGPHVFDEDELGDVLEDQGFASVRTKNFGPIQWVRGRR
jgi:SAM-dependent methyltransferase